MGNLMTRPSAVTHFDFKCGWYVDRRNRLESELHVIEQVNRRRGLGCASGHEILVAEVACPREQRDRLQLK
jgi:hypothetical protein